MNRRTVIRNFVFITAGATILPSCLHHDATPLYPLRNFTLTGEQQDLVADLAETIIPTSKSFIGSRDLKAHQFVLKMVDDCFNPADQKKFTEGLTAFEEFNKQEFGGTFKENSTGKKKELLAVIESMKEVPEPVLSFYGTVKHYTVQCFTSSKKFMTDIRHFKLVPGSQFKGCVPVKNA